MSTASSKSQPVVQTSNPKMASYHRTQSRVTKAGGSRFGIRLADVSAAVRYIVCCLAQAVSKLWYLNPVSLILRRWRQLHHLNTRMTLRVRPRLIDLATDFFLSDDRRKRQLLCWVKSILPWLEEEVFDFTACWQDGIALCALMESISPGACPKFNLLKAHHRVNNCRLGIQLAMRYLHVTELPLSPEEMAIAEEDSEVKICHLVQLLKWKYQKQGSKPAVFSTVSLEQPAQCKCQARGTGIKAGIVGKRTKFNILTESVTNLDLLIEIRGPNKEYNKERIVSMNTGAKSRFRDNVKAAVASASEEDGKRKIIEDGAGHSFLRQKSLDEDQGHLVIPFDYQCVGEGRFLVTYIPRNAGLHAITVLSGGVNIAGSPFEVKVSNWVSSWNLLPKSPMVPFDMLKPVEETPQDPGKPTEQIMRKLSHVAHVSKQLTRMKRRILRKVITPSGEAIICDVTPTLSRQNSGELDLSGDDRRCKGVGWSRSAHSKNKAKRTNDQISENDTDTNQCTQQNTSEGTTESLKVSSDSTSSSSSSPLKYNRPSRDAGDSFAATVVAARIAMASAAEDINNSRTDLANRATANTEDSLLTSVNEDVQCNPLTSGFSAALCSNTETTPPGIVITPNFEDHHDGAGNNKHALIRQNTVNANVSNNSANNSTEPSNVVLSSFDKFSTGSDSRSGRQTAADSEWKNDQQDSKEAFTDLCNGDGSSKTPSPLLRVSDVVGTLLSNLKQDKRDQPVSPAHRHYMRSFSVDEIHHHQHGGNFNQDWSYSVGGSTFPSVATTTRHSDGKNSIPSYPKQHTLPALNDSTISLDDNCDDISQDTLSNTPSIESSFNENKISTDKLDDDVEVPIPQDDEAEFNRGNSYLSCLEEVHTKTCPESAGNITSCGEIYCTGCTHCMQEPAIKKKDLDQRVYEIIEEISERDNDSMRHEDDISETSVDGIASDGIQFHEVNLNFQDDMKLSTTYKSLADLSTDMAASRLPSYQTSLSFDISDIRPKHTILWSQSKSFSEERKLRKSLSYPYRADSVVDKEWADLTAISYSSVTSDRHCSHAEGELFTSDRHCSHAEGELFTSDRHCADAEGELFTSDRHCADVEHQLFTSDRHCADAEDELFTSDRHCGDAEDELSTSDRHCGDELFSSDSDQVNHNIFTETSRGDKQNRISSFANNLFDISNLFDNKESIEILEHVSKKHWSQTTVMPRANTNDLHGVNSPNDVFDCTTHERRDAPPKTHECNTFHAISSLNESSVPDQFDQLNYIQNGVLNEELDTEDDEILQIIINESVLPISINGSLGNSKTILVPTSLASEVPDVSVNQSHSGDSPSVSQHGDTFEVSLNERTPCVDMSPLSDVSNKSGNSDWSENETSPTRNADYQKSTRRRSSSKGDWSPQLVDLTCNGSLVSETESAIRNEAGHSIRVPNEDSNNMSYSTEESVTNPKVNKKLSDSFRRNESTPVSYVHFGSKKTQGTQYELPPLPPSDTENINSQLAPEYSTEALLKNYKQTLSTMSGNHTISYCSHRLGSSQVAGNFPYDTVSDEHTVYVKRRRKPLYTHDNSTGNYQINPNQVSANFQKAFVDTKHPVFNNILSEPEFSDHDDTNSFFATLRLLSPDLANCLSLDNLTNSNSSYIGDCVYDRSVYFQNEHEDYSWNSTEMSQLHTNYFRERTLTPTKYRQRKQNTRRKEESRQRSSVRGNTSSLEHRNTEYPLLASEHTEDWTDTEQDMVTVKLVTQPGSTRVSMGFGDRTLTPTKYRRSGHCHGGSEHAFPTKTPIERKLKQQSQVDEMDIPRHDSEFSSDDETLSSPKQPEASAFNTGNHFLNSNRIKSNTFVSNKKGTYYSDKNSFTPIGRQINEVSTNLAYEMNLENTIVPSCEKYRPNNIQAQMISPSHRTDNIQTCVDPLRHNAPASSLSSRDLAVDDNGCMLYVRKRRKIMLEKTDGKNNAVNHNDNNKPSNMFDYQIADVELYDTVTKHTPSVYTEKFNQQRSQLQQHHFQQNYQHENPSYWRQQHQTTAAGSHHYSDGTCHSVQAFPLTNTPNFTSPPSPHYTQYYQEHPMEYLPQHLPMEDQMYKCNKHQATVRQELSGNSLQASPYHSHQGFLYQPRGQKVQQQQSDSCLDQRTTVRQRRHHPKLHLQTRQEFQHSQDNHDFLCQRNSPLYKKYQHQEHQHQEHLHQKHQHQEHQHQEHLHQKHQDQEHLQLEEQPLHPAATQEKHSHQPHQERQADEGRGNREVVLVRLSTLDTPDSGITDDSMHYSEPVTDRDNMEDRL